MTKGQVEAQLCEAIVKFEKEYMGRGPIESKSYIVKDMIVIRLKGVLTPAEIKLSKTSEGSELIKKTRAQLLESGRELLEGMITAVTNVGIISLHSDISTKTGERMIIFILEKNYEDTFN